MSPGQGLRPGRGLFLFQFIVLEEKLDIKFIFLLLFMENNAASMPSMLVPDNRPINNSKLLLRLFSWLIYYLFKFAI